MEQKKISFYAKVEGWLSLISNVLLFVLKYWVGIISGSVALIADAWHTLSDSLTSVILLIAIKISDKPADENHPFGHGRAEVIASLIIGVLLSVIAFNFMLESINKFLAKEEANFGKWAIIATIISIIVKELSAQYALWAHRKTGMNSLKAEAWHHRSDAISSVIILFGIFFGSTFWWLDSVLGIMVALLIFYASFEVIRDAVRPLMGQNPSKEFEQKIKNLISRITELDVNFHHLHIHNYGNHNEITFHIKLPAHLTLFEAHKVSEQIENAIRKEMNIEATIHIEPFNTSFFKSQKN
ncbi:MAG: cation diffusion facilitator family transporter [Bacteroidales bacterium]|nr:cation diffusion facilitator family transporter [Bacteroidales bacterium]